jgi:transposase
MIPRALEAEILRLYQVEHWPIGTIAAQLRVHHSTVRRVLAQAGMPAAQQTVRASMVEPYLAFIVETLTKYPTLRASRLYAMVRERGYPGAADHFRAIVARLRPRPAGEAYLRLRTLPGEQMQLDWAHFGTLAIGRAERPLMGFVMVLSYSRHLFLRFYLGAAMSYFIRAHVEAFTHFQGVARTVLYDNLKSAVLERLGDAIRFHPTLLELAAHYRFQPRPVAVARGNEKGRIERAIRFARDAFRIDVHRAGNSTRRESAHALKTVSRRLRRFRPLVRGTLMMPSRCFRPTRAHPQIDALLQPRQH